MCKNYVRLHDIPYADIFWFANEMTRQRIFNDSETLVHPTRDLT